MRKCEINKIKLEYEMMMLKNKKMREWLNEKIFGKKK